MPISEPQVLSINGLAIALSTPALGLAGIDYQGERWLTADEQSLWTLLAVDEGGQRVVLDGSMAQDVQLNALDASGAVLTWLGVTDAATGAGPFDVRVEIRPDGADTGSSAWRIAVENHADAWTLWHVVFPLLPGVPASAAPDTDQLFYPAGWGTQHTGWAAMPSLKHIYPMGWNFAMQFFGLTRGDNTLYFGVHDPGLTLKEFAFHPEQQQGQWRGQFSVTNFPEGMTTAGNSYRQAYDTVLAVLPGDWYAAAQRYGAWGRAQSWVTTPPAGSITTPRVAREVHAWQVLYFPQKSPEAWAESMAQLAERCGVRLGIHFYHWHQVPFDTSYPDYFPPRPGFPELAAQMRALGIVTMPYINARLWDINAPSWPVRGAEHWATKLSGQRLHPLTLYPYLADYGNGQQHASMCPVTPFWQETVRDLCDRIVHELGCDAVYLDQVAAEKAVACFDPGHGHAPGGGSFWLAGYRELMAGVRRAVGSDVYLTTECNWEGCIADFDALLMWHTFGEQLIPLYPAVYAGVARTFGCQFGDITADADVFVQRMAMLLLWGAQLGWGDLTQLLEPGQEALLDYFACLCHVRAEHAEIFATGRLLHPPLVDGPAMASLWTGEADTTLFLVNLSPQPARVVVRLTAGETPVVDDEMMGLEVRAIKMEV